MMKKILLFILMLYFEKYCCNSITANIKSVSINGIQIEETHDIKLEKEDDINCTSHEEFLNLTRWHIKSIPNDMINSNTIKHINLHDNFLEKVPHNFLKRLMYLSCFNLSHNNINLYKGNEIQHENLQVLDLSNQEMSNVNIISDVETFNIESQMLYSRMVFNSSKMRVPNLKFLDLSGNDIATLLWDFSISFPQLVRLDLADINGLILDPNFFKKIPNSLRILHLENNYFHELNLPNTAEITELYLDGNPLQSFHVTSAKLEILSLSNCTYLRKIYLITPYLKQLDLSKNNLNEEEFSMNYDMFRTLRVLLLDHNKFLTFPVLIDMQWLNELSMSYNMIEHIKPDSFKYIRLLKKLSLKGNKLSNINKETFNGLEQLESLDLAENQLTYLVPDWAFSLKKLQYLNVKSNTFSIISDLGIYSVNSLKHLLVMNNTFNKVTTLELEPLPNFVTVYLV